MAVGREPGGWGAPTGDARARCFNTKGHKELLSGMYRSTKIFRVFDGVRFENHKTVWLTAFVFLSLYRNGLCVPLCSFFTRLKWWHGGHGRCARRRKWRRDHDIAPGARPCRAPCRGQSRGMQHSQRVLLAKPRTAPMARRREPGGPAAKHRALSQRGARTPHRPWGFPTLPAGPLLISATDSASIPNAEDKRFLPFSISPISP